MIQVTTLRYLKDLKKNNTKNWFEQNRGEYEAAKTDFAVFVGNLISGISSFDIAIGNLQVKECTFRINRDIRFSKDKTPYKTNMGAYFSKAGKKGNAAGYYFQCEPGKSFAGGGFYTPYPSDLAKIRQEIDYNFEEWNKIVGNKDFRKCFVKGVDGLEVLSRPPKGYEANNPAIEYLKMKNFVVKKQVHDIDLKKPGLLKETLKIYEIMKPFIDFLNGAVSA